MRTIALACLALGAVGCAPPVNVAEMKPKLRNYLTEQMRTHGCSAIRTDEDSRARPPTKFAEATQGLAFSVRHSVKIDEAAATISTWVYHSRAARDAAKAGPYTAITDDLSKAGTLFRVYTLDAGDLHMIILMESPTSGLANQFQILFKEISGHSDEISK